MKLRYTINDCKIISLPKISNRAGNITAIEGLSTIPFAIRRIYYLYDVPGGESRGAHAHKDLEQILLAASGSFDITIDDGCNQRTINLNRPYLGLHLMPGIWRDLSNFSSGAICLVIASLIYQNSDYIRDYQEFLRLRSSS